MEEEEKRFEDMVNLLRSGLRSGSIHTICVGAIGDGYSEIHAHQHFDSDELDANEIATINFQMSGVLFHLIQVCQSGNRFEPVDRSASLFVVDAKDPEE